MKSTKKKGNRVIILGCSKFGASIARQLSKEGESVLVIDNKESAFDKLEEEFSGYTIVADATDIQTLENNEIADAKKIIISTDNDNINVFLAHVCSKFYNIHEIYVRLSDTRKGKLIEKDENIRAIYPFVLSMDYFNRLSRD